MGATLIHLSLGVLVGDPEELVLHERLQKDLVSMRTVLHDALGSACGAVRKPTWRPIHQDGMMIPQRIVFWGA